MKLNALRRLLAEGKPAYGTMIQTLRTPIVGQVMALAGCDFIFFDMEHGPPSVGTVADMVRVTRVWGVRPLVRVKDAQYLLMVRPFEFGAQGIMIPRV